MSSPEPTDSVSAETGPMSRLPRGVVLALGAAGTVITVAGMRELAWMLGPVFLALMLVVAAAPIQTVMLRRGWPRWMATIAVLVLLYSVLVGLASVLFVSVGQLTTLLPQYGERATQLLSSAEKELARLHIGNDQITQVVGQIDLNRVVNVLGTVLSSVTSVLTTLFFMLLMVFFMGVDAAGFPRRLMLIGLVRPSVAEALTSFARGTRRYLVVSSIFGAICSVLDVIALAWLSVPLPILWGVLAFITNYIPNIGFFVGLVPPVMLAVLDGGVKEALFVVGAYLLINVVIQTVIQPKYIGDVVGLSVTMTFLALAFWAWVLGPLGALLAIPLTLLAKALLVDVDPGSRWVDLLIGSEPADDHPAVPVESAVEPAESAAEPAEPAESAVEPIESAAEPVESAVEGCTEPAEGRTEPPKGGAGPVEGAAEPVG